MVDTAQHQQPSVQLDWTVLIAPQPVHQDWDDPALHAVESDLYYCVLAEHRDSRLAIAAMHLDRRWGDGDSGVVVANRLHSHSGFHRDMPSLVL